MAKIDEELDWTTDKISSRVWTLNLGTLATTWSLLIAAGSSDKLIGNANALPIMSLCILAMLFDLGQYCAAYWNARSIEKGLKGSDRDEYEYDKSAFLYKLRVACFYIKIVLSLVAGAWLFVTLVWKFIYPWMLTT